MINQPLRLDRVRREQAPVVIKRGSSDVRDGELGDA